MIESFKSKALRLFWEKNDPSKVQPIHHERVTDLLSALEKAARPESMNLPGFGFHKLTGGKVQRYAVSVNKNWRITFAWIGGDATDVDLEDYH